MLTKSEAGDITGGYVCLRSIGGIGQHDELYLDKGFQTENGGADGLRQFLVPNGLLSSHSNEDVNDELP